LDGDNLLEPSFLRDRCGKCFSNGFFFDRSPDDYKESEKLPGELAASIESIAEEAMTIYKKQKHLFC